MCWKCDSVEIVREPMKKQGIKLDTWYWFGILGLGFMVLSILTFAVGLLSR